MSRGRTGREEKCKVGKMHKIIILNMCEVLTNVYDLLQSERFLIIIIIIIIITMSE